MSGNSLEHQLRMGKITHLMELEANELAQGMKGYVCAFCELRVAAPNLRQARRTAEDTYGKCPGVGENSERLYA